MTATVVEIFPLHSSHAIDLLKSAERFDLCGGTGEYQIYLRGDAYLAARNGKAAAAEFQTFVDRKYIGVGLLGALARAGLARADALQGNSAKAKAEYQDFLNLWKNADPDIPILEEANVNALSLPQLHAVRRRRIGSNAQWMRAAQHLQAYCSFAYSALACFKTGISGSASFQAPKKS